MTATKTDEARKLLAELEAAADAVIEGCKPGGIFAKGNPPCLGELSSRAKWLKRAIANYKAGRPVVRKKDEDVCVCGHHGDDHNRFGDCLTCNCTSWKKAR